MEDDGFNTNQRPRLWDFEKYNEITVVKDSQFFDHPAAFGEAILRVIAKGEPVVIVPAKEE